MTEKHSRSLRRGELEPLADLIKLLNGYLNFFDCGNNKQSFAREAATWNAEELEQALTHAGLPACRVHA